MKKHRKAAIISIAGSIFIILVHLMPPASTMINLKTNSDSLFNPISNGYMVEIVELHKTHPSFARRPFTTFLIEGIANNTPINLVWAFILVNSLFSSLSAYLIYYLGILLKLSHSESILSIFAFFLSHSVLMAYFPTVYTYDEPIQYFLLFSSLVFLVKEKFLAYAIVFTASLISRESGMLLLPSILLFFWSNPLKKETIIRKRFLFRSFILILPLFLYAAYLYLFISQNDVIEEGSSELSQRISDLFVLNFGSPAAASESIISLFLAIGPQVYLLYTYVMKNKLGPVEKKWISAFLLSLLINTIVVFFTTKTRENRLFALPLVFLWPILGKYLHNELQLIRNTTLWKSLFSKLQTWIIFFFFTMLAFLVSFYVYQPTGTNKAYTFHDEYLFLILLLICSHLALNFQQRKTEGL